MRVSAGLDSLVIGEGQILSQVKKWYELASDAEGHAGKLLQRLLNTAVSAGKRVRSETGIAKGAVSISSAAVELAEMKAIPDLDLPLREAKVCILGAGKMSRLLVQHLLSRGVLTSLQTTCIVLKFYMTTFPFSRHQQYMWHCFTTPLLSERAFPYLLSPPCLLQIVPPPNRNRPALACQIYPLPFPSCGQPSISKDVRRSSLSDHISTPFPASHTAANLSELET